MAFSWPWHKPAKPQGASKILWLDLGDLGDLVNPSGPHEQWQDHGLGLLRTILHQNGVQTDLASTRTVASWDELAKQMKGYDMLLMNVRSYTFPSAYKSAQIFKELNPQALVLAGGMHATVAPDEMLAIPEFDRICQGPGEKIIVDLVKDPAAFPRLVQGDRRQVDGRVADDRPHAVAAAARRLAHETALEVAVAAGTRMRLGTGPGGDAAHQPRLPLAVRLL